MLSCNKELKLVITCVNAKDCLYCASLPYKLASAIYAKHPYTMLLETH